MCSQNPERERFEKFICQLQYISPKALNIKIFFMLARLHYHPLDQENKKNTKCINLMNNKAVISLIKQKKVDDFGYLLTEMSQVSCWVTV